MVIAGKKVFLKRLKGRGFLKLYVVTETEATIYRMDRMPLPVTFADWNMKNFETVN